MGESLMANGYEDDDDDVDDEEKLLLEESVEVDNETLRLRISCFQLKNETASEDEESDAAASVANRDGHTWRRVEFTIDSMHD